MLYIYSVFHVYAWMVTVFSINSLPAYLPEALICWEELGWSFSYNNVGSLFQDEAHSMESRAEKQKWPDPCEILDGVSKPFSQPTRSLSSWVSQLVAFII